MALEIQILQFQRCERSRVRSRYRQGDGRRDRAAVFEVCGPRGHETRDRHEEGRERNVILSIDTYERLMKRDRVAYRAEDTPPEFMSEIDRLIDSLPEVEAE